jgi:hypothetical protein
MVSFPDRHPLGIRRLPSNLSEIYKKQPYLDCPKKETPMIAARQQRNLHSPQAPYLNRSTMFA